MEERMDKIQSSFFIPGFLLQAMFFNSIAVSGRDIKKDCPYEQSFLVLIAMLFYSFTNFLLMILSASCT
jgi:hypothetical protein